MLNSRSRAALPSPRFFGADPMHAIAESPIYPHREDSMPYSLMAKVSDGNSPSRSVRAVRHPDPVFRNDTLGHGLVMSGGNIFISRPMADLIWRATNEHC